MEAFYGVKSNLQLTFGLKTSLIIIAELGKHISTQDLIAFNHI